MYSVRLGLVLNVRHEKMDQRSVKDGLHAAIAQRSGVKLTKYTVGESTLIPVTSASELATVFNLNKVTT